MKLNINSVDYKVDYIDKDLDMNGYNGKVYFDSQLIKVRKSLPHDTKAITLLHEIIHVLLDSTGLQRLMDNKDLDNEHITEVLSNTLYNLFKTNPKLITELQIGEYKNA